MGRLHFRCLIEIDKTGVARSKGGPTRQPQKAF
jgi:hypothetical protein